MNTTNRKLTKLIAGRTIKHTSRTDGHLLIEFADQSVLKIKSEDSPPGCDGRTVKSVRQREQEFEFIFTDDSSVKISMIEETSSVMVRDKNGDLEYAD